MKTLINLLSFLLIFNGIKAQCSTSIISDNLLCFGSCDGYAIANASGVAPFDYLWSTGDTTSTINNLCAGTYSVSVTDVNGCVSSDSVTIFEPNQIVISPNVVSPSCDTCCDGYATLNVYGGTAPYLYSWDGGATYSTNDSISGLCNGVYPVYIEDANGCTEINDVNIFAMADSTNCSASITSDNLLCFGSCNGYAIANASGAAPFEYLWSNGDTTSAINNLCAGTYSVSVTDVNGCVSSDSVTIFEPNQIIISPTIVGPSCDTCCDGYATINVYGGTAPYLYSWDGGLTYTTNDSISGLCDSTYPVYVEDGNGCTEVLDIIMSSSPTVGLNNEHSVVEVQVFPNPTNGNIKIEAENIMYFSVCDMSGREIKTVSDINENELTIDLENLNSGNYLLRVMTSKGLKIKKVILK